MSELRRDKRAVVVHSPATRKTLQHWADDVARAWLETWKGRDDHRYGKDFAAFMGERFLTDFDMRDVEDRVRA